VKGAASCLDPAIQHHHVYTLNDNQHLGLRPCLLLVPQSLRASPPDITLGSAIQFEKFIFTKCWCDDSHGCTSVGDCMTLPVLVFTLPCSGIRAHADCLPRSLFRWMSPEIKMACRPLSMPGRPFWQLPTPSVGATTDQSRCATTWAYLRLSYLGELPSLAPPEGGATPEKMLSSHREVPVWQFAS